MSDKDLQYLIDRNDLWEMLTHYTFLLDSRQHDRIPDEIYTEDAVVRYLPGFEARGREEIRQMLTPAMERFVKTQHFLGNFHVESLDGDEAEIRTYAQALHWMPVAEADAEDHRPVDMTQVVAYMDKVRRTDDGWKIYDRVLHGFGPTGLGYGRFPKMMGDGFYNDKLA